MKPTQTLQPAPGFTPNAAPPFPKQPGGRPRCWIVLCLAWFSGSFLTPAHAAVPVSLTLKGQWQRSELHAEDIAVQGQYAYVASGEGGLVIVDVSDLANPAGVGGYNTVGAARDVAVAGNFAYVADGWAGLQLIDVSDPTNPERVGGYDTSGDAQGVAVVGHLAYVTDGDAGLQLIDVSDPAKPVRVGGIDADGHARSVAVVGDHAYVAMHAGLQVIDVSDPAKPVRVGGLAVDQDGNHVAVAGNYAYLDVGDEFFLVTIELGVIDISNPATPVRIGGYDFDAFNSDQAVVGTSVAVAGNYAYVAGRWWDQQAQTSRGRLDVIDVSDPANPVRVGRHVTRGEARGVAVVGDLIYVADYEQGLLIFEQSAAPPPPAEWVRIRTDPINTPRARETHAMVYDEKRGVVVMHGGRNGEDIRSDTWVWDDRSWTLVSTNGPRVFQHSMAYDSFRGVTVLYGGRVALGHANPIGDTWEWDGQSWTRVEIGRTTPPPPVIGGMAYDPIRKKVVRQGGITAPDDTFDVGATWEWDGQAWTQIADGFIRGAHSILFDPVRGKMIAFGGSGTSNSSPSPGTWEFNGDEWNLITTDGPPARFTFNRAFVWDVSRNVGVLYGGAANQSKYFDDTWEWDGTGWRKVNVPGPGPRVMHAMAYDAKRRKVVLFGGFRDCFRCDLNETWEYGLPPLRITGATSLGNVLEIRWTGGAPFYQLQRRASLSAGGWKDIGGPTYELKATVRQEGAATFFRVLRLPGNAP